MPYNAVCRACLSSKVRMFLIKDAWFLRKFEEISKTKFTAGDGRPETICFICYSLMKKFCNFIAITQNSERIFMLFLGEGIQITEHTVNHMKTWKPNFCVTRLKSTSTIVSTNTAPEHGIKKEFIEIDRNTYAKPVKMNDILKDFEDFSNNDLIGEVVKKEVIEIDGNTHTETVDQKAISEDLSNHTIVEYPVIEDKKIDEYPTVNENFTNIEGQMIKHEKKNITMNLEHPTLDALNEDLHFQENESPDRSIQKQPTINIDSDTSMTLEQPADDEKNCFILERRGPPIIVKEYHSDGDSEAEEMPLTINEDGDNLEVLQPLIIQEQFQKPWSLQQVKDQKIVEQVNTKTVPLTSLFGDCSSDHENHSMTNETNEGTNRVLDNPYDPGMQWDDVSPVKETSETATSVPFGHRMQYDNISDSETLSEKSDSSNKKQTTIYSEADNWDYYFCDICYNSYKSERNFKNHINRVHPDYRGKTHRRRSQRKDIDMPEDNSCVICYNSYETRVKLRNHIKKIHPDMKLYCCNLCIQYFRRERELRNHFRINHPGGKFKHSCDRCSKKYRKLKYLLIHQKNAHPEPINHYEPIKQYHPEPIKEYYPDSIRRFLSESLNHPETEQYHLEPINSPETIQYHPEPINRPEPKMQHNPESIRDYHPETKQYHLEPINSPETNQYHFEPINSPETNQYHLEPINSPETNHYHPEPINHPEPIKLYSCDVCSKTYDKRLSFKYHVLFVHPQINDL